MGREGGQVKTFRLQRGDSVYVQDSVQSNGYYRGIVVKRTPKQVWVQWLTYFGQQQRPFSPVSGQEVRAPGDSKQDYEPGRYRLHHYTPDFFGG